MVDKTWFYRDDITLKGYNKPLEKGKYYQIMIDIQRFNLKYIGYSLINIKRSNLQCVGYNRNELKNGMMSVACIYLLFSDIKGKRYYFNPFNIRFIWKISKDIFKNTSGLIK